MVDTNLARLDGITVDHVSTVNNGNMASVIKVLWFVVPCIELVLVEVGFFHNVKRKSLTIIVFFVVGRDVILPSYYDRNTFFLFSALNMHIISLFIIIFTVEKIHPNTKTSNKPIKKKST